MIFNLDSGSVQNVQLRRTDSETLIVTRVNVLQHRRRKLTAMFNTPRPVTSLGQQVKSFLRGAQIS